MGILTSGHLVERNVDYLLRSTYPQSPLAYEPISVSITATLALETSTQLATDPEHQERPSKHILQTSENRFIPFELDDLKQKLYCSYRFNELGMGVDRNFVCSIGSMIPGI
jgi:hypothetical protein